MKEDLIRDLKIFKKDMSMLHHRTKLILDKYNDLANPIQGLYGFFEVGLISLQGSIDFVKRSNYIQKDEIIFRSRGISLDYCPGCIFCGNGLIESRLLKTISGFVECENDGNKIVSWVTESEGIKLDFREDEPSWIQVKIGSCDLHEHKLKKLHELCMKNNTISKRIIELANQE